MTTTSHRRSPDSPSQCGFFLKTQAHSPLALEGLHSPDALLHELHSPVTGLASNMRFNMQLVESSPAVKTPRRCLFQDLAASSSPAQDAFAARADPSAKRPFMRTATAAGRLQTLSESLDAISATFAAPAPLAIHPATACASPVAAKDSPVFARPLKNKTNERPPLPPAGPSHAIGHWSRRPARPRDDDKSLGFPIVKNSLKPFKLEKRPLSNSPLRVTVNVEQSRQSKLRRVSEDASESLQQSLSTFSLDSDQPLLPTEPGTDAIKRISPQTMVRVLQGEFKDKYDELLVLDCRFAYEYEGGHIAGAQNVSSPEALEALLFQPPRDHQRTLLIFHCEYSVQRAPRLAQHLRSHDRALNAMNYPQLHYPNVFILKGGYRDFFAQFQTHCEPQAYITMDHLAFKDECKKEMQQHRRTFRKCFSEGFLR